MKKQVLSIFLLSLLLFHIGGFTFVLFWDEWKSSRTYKLSNLIEEREDYLFLKLNLSIPYQSDFSISHTKKNLTIYKGEFYSEISKIYKNDTLYISYKKEKINRDNIYNLLNEVSESLNQFSNNPSQSNKTIDFFKKFIQDYTTFREKRIIYFLVNNLAFHNYKYREKFYEVIHILDTPPPKF